MRKSNYHRADSFLTKPGRCSMLASPVVCLAGVGVLLASIGVSEVQAKTSVIQTTSLKVFSGPLGSKPDDVLPSDVVALWKPFDVTVNGATGKALAEVQIERLDFEKSILFATPPPPKSFWDAFMINKDPIQFRDRLVTLLVNTPLGDPALTGNWTGAEGNSAWAVFETNLAAKRTEMPDAPCLALDPSINEKQQEITLAGQKVSVFKTVDLLRAEIARLIGADAEADMKAGKDPFKERHSYMIAWLAGRSARVPSATVTRPVPKNAAAASTLLRFHGSNTIGGKLLPALATAFLQQGGYSNVHAVPGANEEESSIVGEKNGRPEQIEIKAHGSSTAFQSLKDGLCDIGMASRKIKPAEEAALAPVLGDLSSNRIEHVLALDGIAIIVHPANSLKTLTIKQVADVFSGTIGDWSQVGGKPGPISIYARDDKSGTYDFFNDSVLKTHGKTLNASAKRFEDSKQLSESVTTDIGGIGFIGLNYIGANKVLAVSDTGVEPRKPTLLTVKTEDYMLSRRLYLYTSANPTNPNVTKFIEFALGSEAQPVVASAGLVNMDLAPLPAEANDPRSNSAKWRQLTTGATEIPTRFRFRAGSSELDSRAVRDIGRIEGILSQPKYLNKSLELIGFADASGSASANVLLSQNRVDTIKKELLPDGFNFSQCVGLGADAFVAPNNSAEGKEKNRRVEIWVRD